MEKFTFFITEHEMRELKKLSDESNLSVSELIRRCLDKNINELRKEVMICKN